jgi:hypothetical protein
MRLLMMQKRLFIALSTLLLLSLCTEMVLAQEATSDEVKSNSSAELSPTASPTKVATFAYSVEAGAIAGYTVSPATGRLRPITYLPLPAGGGFEVTVHPTNKFLYMPTGYGNNSGLYGYSINSTNGTLTPIAGSPFSSQAADIVFTPTGKFAYTNHYQGSSAVVEEFSSEPFDRDSDLDRKCTCGRPG